MAGEVVFTFADFSGEKSNVTFTTDDVTAANFDTIETLNGALNTALNGVCAGNINSRRFLASVATPAAGNPASQIAQRELKWLLNLSDSVTGEIIHREVPTADIGTAGLLVSGTDQADMSNAAWVSLKSAIDGNYNNPATGNSLLLISAKLVGRNL